MERATVPIATSMCVLPVPTGPNRTRFRAFLTNAHVVTSSRDSLGGSLTADQSYPSKVLGTGRFARSGRRLPLFESRKASSAPGILEIAPFSTSEQSPATSPVVWLGSITALPQALSLASEAEYAMPRRLLPEERAVVLGEVRSRVGPGDAGEQPRGEDAEVAAAEVAATCV